MKEPDLLIVGGGPAGLFCAIAARRQGLTVELIEARKPPLDKACGEGLMPDGLALLQEAGVKLAKGRSFAGISYHQGDLKVEGRFPAGYAGAGVRRLDLHQALVQRAEEVGVELRWGVKAEAILPTGIQTSEGNLPARYIVAADGLHSKLRQWSGLEAKPAKERRFGVRRHYAIEPWSDLVEVHWGQGVEAYITPVGEKEIGVAFLWSGRKASFNLLLDEFPELKERLAGAEATSKDRGAGPLEQRTQGLRQGKVLLLGDAAGYLDAITGEGLSLAFHQGAALVEAIADGRPESYPKQSKKLCRWPLLLTRLTLALERRPVLRERVLRAFAAEPKLFERFLAVHCRALPPVTLFASGFLVRLLRRMLVPG
jgi:flavin-dependent dehydrogenase